ncbi:hypothetical protein [Sphingomonas lenta]|uniref:Uncharacterized protein n=1 Tax=Sphingomonas lenta TaxID=1141887 RepID=A0A2A2SI50_9SPHN|nr:hypothetical protein [Sphingomonas lenta]PAX08840.1 hypothetical protein CKY28_05660 [Sphingomonas lenta]
MFRYLVRFAGILFSAWREARRRKRFGGRPIRWRGRSGIVAGRHALALRLVLGAWRMVRGR